MLADQVRSRFRLGLCGLAAVAGIGLSLAAAPPARAENVWNVDCSVPELIEAFEAAASEAGSATIDLAPGCTYTFTDPNNNRNGDNALPNMPVAGGALTINGNGATLQRSTAEGTPPFRLLRLARRSTINDLTIENGRANGAHFGNGVDGGGILAWDALTLNRVTFLHNHARSDTGLSVGGGVMAVVGGLNVNDSTFIGNEADGGAGMGGGGLQVIGQVVTVRNSTFTDNKARSGGAIDADGGTYVNNTIVRNEATSTGGGGLFIGQSGNTWTLHNNTIVENVAHNGASAVSGVASARMRGNIIGGSCSTAPGWPGLQSQGYNVILDPAGCPPIPLPPSFCPGGVCGPDVTDATSAGLGPLQDNGGPTKTMAIGPDSPAYQLVDGFCPTTDQRGVSRPQAGSEFCNAGAYETQAVATALAYTGPTSGDYGSPVMLSATLTQPNTAIGLPAPAGAGIAGQSVKIGFAGEGCTATTDGSGEASCQVTPTASPAGGPYQLTASYAGGPDGVGTDYYRPSSDTSQSFTVNRRPTSLTASAVIPSGVSATLTDTGTGAPLAGQTLTFTAGSTELCTAQTSSAGKASCKTLGAVLGAVLHLGYTVSYAGNAHYLPSSAHGSALPLALKLTGASHTTRIARNGLSRAALERSLRRPGKARLGRELQAVRNSRG